MKFAPVLWELRHIGAGTPWKPRQSGKNERLTQKLSL